MQHPNHFEQDTHVTYYGSIVGFDFYMTDDHEILIQFGAEESEYMSMSLEHVRNIKAKHYQAAVLIWDATKEVA